VALTDNCDVFASISESTFNRIVANMARQRPSTFNYGTASFVNAPQLMCEPIIVSPGLPSNQPRVTQEPPIPVPGTNGAWGMEYCAQLTGLLVDFHPGNVITLPPELKPLAAQTLALQVRVCGGIACPHPAKLAELGLQEAAQFPPLDPGKTIRPEDKQQPPDKLPEILPIERERIHCFCLDVFALASLRRDETPNGPALGVDLKGLEIVDIKPEGLENSLECLISATIVLGVLPRLRISLNDILLDLGTYGNLQIGLTPISTAVPFNPSVAKDEISVFVNVTLN